MADSAFLDKGIILGYCFYTDTHYVKCKDYIESTDAELYATKQVEDIFQRKKDNIIKKHRRAITDFIRWVKQEYSGNLNSEDIAEIQKNINREENPVWRYLLDYFEDKSGKEVYPVTKNLRQIARDLEQLAEERNEELQPKVLGWIRLASYPELKDNLSSIFEKDEEDYWIAVDAHDLGCNVDGTTELATNNPSDFDDDAVRDEILTHTAIDEINLVFVSRSYSP
ncbi:hypothetical protein [Halobellus ordinarius]|uniref:hypothetical protein n=1 Tax=Halobellus ordinarius TaxID=3075120 RepID=UPI00288098D0|nr:hypothetical protein [Halobellus sp. ZY16]